MKTLRFACLLFVLSLAASAQVLYFGPFKAPPIDPSQCTPDTQNGQTGVCFASDGVHVSIAGNPFGGALCDSSNPACKGPQGDPGKDGAVGPAGPQGSPGVIVGNTLSGVGAIQGTIQCPQGTGTISNQGGFKSPNSGFCTITFANFSIKIVSIQ